jgi:hypothetical protein
MLEYNLKLHPYQFIFNSSVINGITYAGSR